MGWTAPAVQQVFECRLASVGCIHVFALFVQHDSEASTLPRHESSILTARRLRCWW